MSDKPITPPAEETRPYVTVAEQQGLDQNQPVLTQGDARNGLTRVFGLQPVPESEAPGMAMGAPVQHVFGPGQNAVDPIAAGLDTRFIGHQAPTTRVLTQTGEVGSGNRPYTYVQYTGPEMVKQTAAADNTSAPVEPPALKPPEQVSPAPQAQSMTSPQPLPSDERGTGPAAAPADANASGEAKASPMQAAPPAPKPATTAPAPAPKPPADASSPAV